MSQADPFLCPTCRQRHPVNVVGYDDDGWEHRGKAEKGDLWPCPLCGVEMCALPKPVGKKATTPCYLAHLEATHPELFALPPQDPAAAAVGEP